MTKMKTPRSIGMQLLGVWLLAWGLHVFLPITIPGFTQLLGLLAVVAGLLILLGR